MKRKSILLFFLLFTLNLFCQDEEILILKSPFGNTQKSEEKSKLPLEARMETLWFIAISHIKEQQFAVAEYDVKKILEEGAAWDIKRFTPFAIASVGFFYESLKKDETLQAQYFLKFAALFNPDLPELYFAKADFAWHQKSYFSYFINIFKALYKIHQNDNYSRCFLINFLILIYILMLFLLVIFILYLLYRNFPKIKHDLMELFEKKYNYFSALFITLSLILLPVVLGLSWFWILCYFCMIVFGYSKKSERAILIFLIIIQISAFPVLYYNINKFYQSFSPIIQSAYALQNNDLSSRYVPEIIIISNFVEDPDIIFLLGNLYEASGDTINAIAAYKKAISKNPAHGLSYIGIGNQYFWQANFNAAITEYTNAQKYLPFFTPLYFNLSKAYNQSYQYNKGTEALNTGMAINSRQMLKFVASKPKREIIPVYLSINDAWELLKRIKNTGVLKGKGIRGHEKAYGFASALSFPYSISFVLCLIATPLFHLWRKKNWNYAGICTKCGRSFCSKCKSSSESQIYCTQCIHIYIKKDGVSLDTKVKKMNEVKRFLRQEYYLKKLFNLLLPGFGYFMEEKKIKGFLIMAFFLLLLLFIVFPFPFHSYSFTAISLVFLKRLALIFLVGIWLVGNIRIILEKGGI